MSAVLVPVVSVIVAAVKHTNSPFSQLGILDRRELRKPVVPK